MLSAVHGVNLRGLVLAGLVVGALGVLDDVTVSQASTVFAVYDADPTQDVASCSGAPWAWDATTSPRR